MALVCPSGNNSFEILISSFSDGYTEFKSARILISPSPRVVEFSTVQISCFPLLSDADLLTKSNTNIFWCKEKAESNTHDVTELSNNRTLLFDEIQQNDSGFYQCRVEWQGFRFSSPWQQLTVTQAVMHNGKGLSTFDLCTFCICIKFAFNFITLIMARVCQ